MTESQLLVISLNGETKNGPLQSSPELSVGLLGQKPGNGATGIDGRGSISALLGISALVRRWGTKKNTTTDTYIYRLRNNS